MNKKILATFMVAALATGCSTTPEQTIVDEVANKEGSSDPVITLDDNGFITDDVAIIAISEENYFEEMDEILTEDGFSMRIDNASTEDKQAVLENSTIYFSFDSSKVTQEMKDVVAAQLKFLKKYPKIKVILEGHTDERGSNAYNVVLGEKRANTVKEMLVKSGISSDQIEVISYGEMKPSDTSSGESAWSKNRRVVFIYK